MSRLTESPRWHRYLRFWKANATADVDEEIRFHFESREADLIARGHSPTDAKRIASDEFGDIDTARQRLYGIRRRIERRRERLWWWHHLRADLRYAVRGLRRTPGFALAVIATVALGIGANAAVFSVIDQLLFRPPALLKDPALTRRVYIHAPMPEGPQYLETVVYPTFVDISALATTVDRSALYAQRALAVGDGEDAREVSVGAVTASFFEFFHAPPAVGRYFTEQENAPPSGTPVVVLSYGTWQAQYGGRREILGEKIRVGPTLYTIIGVAPRGFVGVWPDQPPTVFIPFASFADAYGPPGKHFWMDGKHGFGGMLVQLRADITIEAANADLTHTLLQSWAKENGTAKPPTGWSAVAAPVLAERGPLQTTVANVAMLVAGMGIIVLLIAGANVTNLLLARALRRRREIAVRLALGVTRWRLLSQLLVESILLALGGGVAGLLAAQWGGSALRSAFRSGGVSPPVVTDSRTLVFVVGAVALVGLASGVAPAFTARRTDAIRHLKVGTTGDALHQSSTRVMLLVFQAALSMVLLVGAGLFVRSLINARHVRLGYDVAPVLVAGLNFRGMPVDSAGRIALHERLLAAARRDPAVERASLQLNLPLRSRWLVGWFRAPGVDSSALRRADEFYMNAVSPDYFATVGTRILQGRGIEAQDGGNAPGAIVVSSSLAKLLWPDRTAIGQCVKVDADKGCRYVVGVAEDIKSQQLSNDAGLYFYLPTAQYNPQVGSVLVRMRGDAASHADAIRRELQKEMPGASYVTVTPFSDVIDEQTQSWRAGSTMFIVYGLVALLVAAVGLFSVIAYDVEQRRHEMGVRLALGATPGDVARLVLGRGLLVAAVGLAIGGMTTVVLAAKVGSLLFEVSPRDPLVYGLAAGVILTVSAIASFVPANRASRVDPALALRSE
jgi:putative ABC transport system permease protein